LELIDIKNKLLDFEKTINQIGDALKIEQKRLALINLEQQTLENGFWEYSEKSSEVLKQIKELKVQLSSFDKVKDTYENLKLTYELLKEEHDESLMQDVEKNLALLEVKVEKLETSSLLCGEYDTLNAIVTIHAGAGGTESQDWAEMLNRMYLRWCEKSGFEYVLYDIQYGEEAGIKSITFGVKGLYAYGYMKSEKGVHRLVRISPFDANKRRHTSFAALDVMPEIEENVELDIRPEEIQMDTYRASGAGGQHVNKTDSAVRLKHIPTGIVVSCQTERSQIQNKETCMKMLRAKLYQYEQNKTQEKLKEIKGEITENGWGNQIRSYVFCPYTLVKDHRTNYEKGNVQAVMDGEIDEFISAYLKYSIN